MKKSKIVGTLFLCPTVYNVYITQFKKLYPFRSSKTTYFTNIQISKWATLRVCFADKCQ